MIRIVFSRAATRAIISRATDLHGRVWCEECGQECISRADYEVDHCVAEGIRVANDNRPVLTADDGKLLCLSCHDKKTRRDMGEIARTRRLEKHRPVATAGPTEIARRYGMRQEPHK